MAPLSSRRRVTNAAGRRYNPYPAISRDTSEDSPPRLFSPTSNERWTWGKQGTLLALRNLCSDSFQHVYLSTFFKRRSNGWFAPTEQSVDRVQDDGVKVAGLRFSLPTHTIFQAIARVLSEEASKEYRGAVYDYRTLKNMTLRHVNIQRTATSIKMPSVFTTFVIVNQDGLI